MSFRHETPDVREGFSVVGRSEKIKSCVLNNAVVLDTCAKLRKATINFVVSVRPLARNRSAPTGKILMKFDI